MNGTKTIICLAASRKPPSGRCIAGKERQGGTYVNWVRPVSVRPTHEISEEEMRFQDGTFPRLLDVIEIPIIGSKPLWHQLENMLIDDGYYWQKVETATWNELASILDQPQTLWPNGHHTFHGVNDRVTAAVAATLTSSLFLIKPVDLTIRVRSESQYGGGSRRRVRAIFHYKGELYNLVVTDPVAEESLLAKPDNDYTMSDTYLCLSLTEPYGNGDCYKLVAAVLGKQPL